MQNQEMQVSTKITPQLSETENIVSQIWSEVLQQETIKPENNFFELGGDSLMTMMVMFQVKDKLNVDMPPYTISQSPSLREFCEKVNEQLAAIESESSFDGEDFDTQEVESGVI